MSVRRNPAEHITRLVGVEECDVLVDYVQEEIVAESLRNALADDVELPDSEPNAERRKHYNSSHARAIDADFVGFTVLDEIDDHTDQQRDQELRSGTSGDRKHAEEEHHLLLFEVGRDDVDAGALNIETIDLGGRANRIGVDHAGAVYFLANRLLSEDAHLETVMRHVLALHQVCAVLRHQSIPLGFTEV